MGVNDAATDGPVHINEESIPLSTVVTDSKQQETIEQVLRISTPSEAEESIIKRALSYPYARPQESYLYRDGQSHVLPKTLPNGLHFVLAIGSNAAPSQLRRKFGDGVSIPVVSVEVHGLEVVYAGMVSCYGSIPATVIKSTATVLHVHATLLTNGQLRRMHETEGGYYFCKVGGDVRVVRDGEEVECVYCYVTRRGALRVEGEVFAISEIVAEGRWLDELTQRDMQDVVQGLVGWGEETEEFILKNVRSKERQEEIMRVMNVSGELDDCFEVVEDNGETITSVA